MPGTVLEIGITSPRRDCILVGLNEFNIVMKRDGVLISKAGLCVFCMFVVVLFLIRQWISNCHRL